MVEQNSEESEILTVLLPTYNEAENLPILLELLHKAGKEVRERFGTVMNVLVIDDSSPDGTYDVAVEMSKAFDNNFVHLIKRPGKLGLGSAYRTGLLYVKEKLKSSLVVIMDCDLSHHPKYIGDFLEVYENKFVDIVVGSRYYNKKVDGKVVSGGVEGWNFKRKLTSFTANFLVKMLFNIGTSDVTGSFRLYKTDVLLSLVENMQSTGFSFQVETIVKAKMNNYKIDEVPIMFYDRVHGESKLGTNEITQFLRTLFQLLWLQPVGDTFYNLFRM